MKDKIIIIDENFDIYLVKNNNKINLEMFEEEEILLGVGCETIEEVINEIKYILKKSEEINRELKEREELDV